MSVILLKDKLRISKLGKLQFFNDDKSLISLLNKDK